MGLGVLCLLCAGALAPAWLPSVAAPSAWHPNPARPHGIGSKASSSSLGGIHDRALPPLSAPPPTAGADLPAPHFGFPLQPTLGFAAPPRPSGGEGYPFIGSNPTVPLPTGMTDTATVLPMPDTGAGGTATKVVGHAAFVPVQITIIGLALFFSILLSLSSSSYY